ncbi:MAG: energy transducer TonB [Opitutaceae bacterium]|nr:energy transducer TonB [Opitutaceae bacterium]
MIPLISVRIAMAAAFLGALAGCETTSRPTPPVVSGALPAAADAPASAPITSEVFDVSKLDQVPVPRFQARPQYPFELRRRGVAGEVIVDFVVDVNGDVRNPYALRATHPGFGPAAVAAVAQWKFEPGRKGGRDVNTHMQVPIVFTLDKPVSPDALAAVVRNATAQVALEAIDISKLDVKPIVVSQARPRYPADLRTRKISGEAVVDFVVDVEGNVRNAFAPRSTHPEFAMAAVEAVAQWKFKPGQKGGREVNTHMQVPIVFTLNAN